MVPKLCFLRRKLPRALPSLPALERSIAVRRRSFRFVHDIPHRIDADAVRTVRHGQRKGRFLIGHNTVDQVVLNRDVQIVFGVLGLRCLIVHIDGHAVTGLTVANERVALRFVAQAVADAQR